MKYSEDDIAKGAWSFFVHMFIIFVVIPNIFTFGFWAALIILPFAVTDSIKNWLMDLGILEDGPSPLLAALREKRKQQ